MNQILTSNQCRFAAVICLVLVVATFGCLNSLNAAMIQAPDEKDKAIEKGESIEKADSPTDGAQSKESLTEDAPEESGDQKKEKKVDFSAIDDQFRDLKPLSKTGEVWFSPTDNVVLVGGMICLNRGQLEMFACTPGTKEHESIVVINGKAFEVHVGLLAIGAKSGTKVEWTPEFRPPTGEEIVVEVHWFDKSGMAQKVNAQEWIQDSRTKKAMEYPWVFAGSEFYVDEDSGEKFYLAEGGEVICVSNFSTAMLDVPAKSDDVNDGLLFSAFHERIPEIRTPVRLVLRMKIKEEKEADAAKEKPKKAVTEDKKPDQVNEEPKEPREQKEPGEPEKRGEPKASIEPAKTAGSDTEKNEATDSTEADSTEKPATD